MSRWPSGKNRKVASSNPRQTMGDWHVQKLRSSEDSQKYNNNNNNNNNDNNYYYYYYYY
jgi:hypothetical protein